MGLEPPPKRPYVQHAPDSASLPASVSPRTPARTILLYSCGNFGAGVFYAMNNFVMQSFLLPLGVSTVVYGVLANQRSFEGAVIQPIVGARSDRTWNRLGRRKPFIVAFLPISVLFLVLTPLLPRLAFLGKPLGWSSAFTAIVLASAGVFLFSVTFNVQIDPYNTLLADLVPTWQRGGANGLFQAIGALGQVAILLTGIVVIQTYGVAPLFYITAAALVVFFLPTLLGIREPPHLLGTAQRPRYRVRDYWDGIRDDRQIQLYFATQFFLWFGIATITPFLTPYAQQALHFTARQALLLALVLLLSSSVFVWPMGVIADRVGLKRVLVLGMCLLAGTSIAGIFVRDLPTIFIVLAIGGIGNAAQTASSYPLLTRLAFPDRMGLYTGLFSAVTSITAPLAGVIAGYLFSAIGPTSMFPFIACMFVLALAPLGFLRLDRSAAARMQDEASGAVARSGG